MITVKVCGSAGVGKTTVAVLIEQALKDAGLLVLPFKTQDEDEGSKARFLWESGPEVRKALIQRLSPVNIEEVQLRQALFEQTPEKIS